MSTIVRDFTVNARYDLQAPSVQIFYETASEVNGASSLSLSTDFYPQPLPTDPQKQFAALQFTVDLQGLQASVTTAAITVDGLAPNDPNWWLARQPEHKLHDPTNPADAGNAIASLTLDATSLQRTPNPAYDAHGNPVADNGYANELTTGQLTDWMTFKSQRLTFKVNATITYRNGTVETNKALTYQCLATNAVSGTYTSQTVVAYPEPVPIGLAQFIYEAISVLQFEGELHLQEADVSGSLGIGQLFNLTGGALAEWSTMAALVQSVAENIDTGQTQIQFGPPRNLSAGELVDLLRVNRARLIRSAYSMRAAGTPGDSSGNVDLGQNTPEKNSVSGTAPANPQVISGTVDGSGAVVTHASSTNDCSSSWQAPSGWTGIGQPGSIVIQLSNANGQHLSIRALQVCYNGVSGVIYGLFSDFIPD